MHLRSWLEGLRTRLTRRTSIRRKWHSRSGRPSVEALEDRTLLSTVTAIVLEGQLQVTADSDEDLVIREDPVSYTHLTLPTKA